MSDENILMKWSRAAIVLVKQYPTYAFVATAGLALGAHSYLKKEEPVAKPPELAFSDFVQEVKKNNVKDVVVQGYDITGHLKNNSEFVSREPFDASITGSLLDHNVKVTAKGPPVNTSLIATAIDLIMPLAMVGYLIYSTRRMLRPAGKNSVKLFKPGDNDVTFDDVAGADEAKEDLKEIVDFLKDPESFQRLGGEIPRGAILCGGPGTGKTLLARAVAGEAHVPFFSAAGSDFIETFVGVGARRVRDMFKQAKKHAPCIVFIDEIDVLGGDRDEMDNSEQGQTINQLLTEMDGFEGNSGVIVLGATNRIEAMDPALLRPGRFDRRIVVPNPNVADREAILGVHLDGKILATDVDAKVIARSTPGFSGADLKNLVNEAALHATREKKDAIGMADFEAAKDKIIIGAKRKSMIMTPEEKKLTAVHEAGHAIVGLNVDESDPLHKISIVPHGQTLGVTMSLPERDQYSQSKTKLESMLTKLFGGREAEKLIFGEGKVTTGAANDIQKATEIAVEMVTSWGMSSLGSVRYSTQDMPQLDQIIYAEVRNIVQSAENRAGAILKDNRESLDLLWGALLEKETMAGDEVRDLLKDTLPVLKGPTRANGMNVVSLPPQAPAAH